MVFQSYALFPNMSGRRKLGYGLKIRRESEPSAPRRVAELVKLTASEGWRTGASITSGGSASVSPLRARRGAAGRVPAALSTMRSTRSMLRSRAPAGELDRLLRSLGITTCGYVTHDQSRRWRSATASW